MQKRAHAFVFDDVHPMHGIWQACFAGDQAHFIEEGSVFMQCLDCDRHLAPPYGTRALQMLQRPCLWAPL